MTGREPSRAPDVTQVRVQRLIQQLAWRIRAGWLPGAGTRETAATTSSDEMVGGPVRSEIPTTVHSRSSGQRALLCQLLADGRAPIRGAGAGSRVRGRR